MCGIVGYFGSSPNPLTRILGGMASILYRAPDSTGAAWFGDDRESIRTCRAVGSVPTFVEALLTEGVYPDRAAALRRLWRPSAGGAAASVDTADKPATAGTGDLSMVQAALLRWEELPACDTESSSAPSYDQLLDPEAAGPAAARPGTRGRPTELPAWRVRNETELVELVEGLAVEFDLPPLVSRILIRRALSDVLRGAPPAREPGDPDPATAQAAIQGFDALFHRVISHRLFYAPMPGPRPIRPPELVRPGPPGAAPVAEHRVWELLQSVEIRVPEDFDRDGVRNLFRLLDAQVLTRIPGDPELDRAIRESLERAWPQLRGRDPRDWLALYQAEKSANVFGRAAAAAWDAVNPPGAAALDEPRALRYLACPVIAHGRWALQSPVTVRNAHPFRDAEGRRAVVLNGQFSADVERELKEFLSRAGFSFRSENSAEYLALLWGYYFEVLRTEQRRAATIRAHVDGGLEGYCLGSQAIDYRVFAVLKGKSEAELDEMAFIEATRRIVQRGGQVAAAGQSLYSPRRLYVASHNRPLFLARRREGEDVMVVSDLNAATGLFRQEEFLTSYRELRRMQERTAEEIGALKAAGAGPAELHRARERRRQQEQEILQRFRLRVVPLEGPENFARIEAARDRNGLSRRIEVGDFDGNPRTEIEELDTCLNPLEAEREVFTSFYETHLREVPDRLRDMLSIYLSESEPLPRLPLNRRMLHKRFGDRLETLKRIVLVGMGSSHNLARIAGQVLRSLLPGREVIAVAPVESEHVLHIVDPEKDLVLCLSWTGTTAETVEYAAALLQHKAVFLAVTNKPYSDLGLLAWKSLGVVNLMSGEELTVAAVKSPPSLLLGACLLGVWLSDVAGRPEKASEMARALQELPDHLERTLGDPVLGESARRLAGAASACRYALIVDDLHGLGTGRQWAHALGEAGHGMVVKVLDYRELRVASLRDRGQELLVVVNADGRREEAREVMKRLFLEEIPFLAVGGNQEGADAARFYSRDRWLGVPALTGISRAFVDMAAFALFALQLAQAQDSPAPGFPRNRVKSVTAGRTRSLRPTPPGAELELLSGDHRPGGAAPAEAPGLAPEGSKDRGARPSRWERAGAFEWEQSRYRGIRDLARELGGDGPARRLFADLPAAGSPVYRSLAENLSEGGEILLLCLDRPALCAGAGAAALWSRLSGAHVRADTWPAGCLPTGRDGVVCVLASRPPDRQTQRGLAALAEALPGTPGQPACCWVGPPGFALEPGSRSSGSAFVLGPEAAGAVPEGLYLAMAALLAEIWSLWAPRKAEAVERLLAGTHPAVEAILADAGLKESINAALEANRSCRAAYFVGPSPGLCLGWTLTFERPGALFLAGHLYGEGAHGPLGSIDPDPQSKFIPLEARSRMVAKHGKQRVEAWERRFLEPGVGFDDLSRGEAESSPPRRGRLFFSGGSWYLPVLRPEGDASRDALIVIDATSDRTHRRALDELAVYGCRFARLVVLTQSAFEFNRDIEDLAVLPFPGPLSLPAIGESAPVPDGLLPVAAGLLATAFAAASCGASGQGQARAPARGGEEELLVRRAFGQLGEALLRSGIPLSALDHAQVAALRSLAPLVTGIRRSARFEVRRAGSAREVEELGRRERVRRLLPAGGQAAGGQGVGRAPEVGESAGADGAPGEGLFLLRPDPASPSGTWTEAFGTSWDALCSRNVAIGERLDGTPLLELPVLEGSGESGRLYRFTVRYLEWDHGRPLGPQLAATIEAMQKGLPSLHRQSPGYAALAGGFEEALRASAEGDAQVNSALWNEWLLALVPRSWLLRKPSLELARTLAHRTCELLSRGRAGGVCGPAPEALAAAGSALAELWSGLAAVDSGCDEERWPLLRRRLRARLGFRPAAKGVGNHSSQDDYGGTT